MESKYGIKIKNYSAGSVYEKNLGVREKLDSKDAMLTNSLFLDFLMENGLNVKNGSTRDVICIEFKYGSSDFETHDKKLKEALQRCTDEGKKLKLLHVIEQSKKKESQYKKVSADDIRIEYYTNGVEIPYPIFKKGKIIANECVKYKFLYRTPGKAKNGSAMFIRKELYDKANDFITMGIQLPKKNAPIVEIAAYSSLITSSIVGRIEIDPKNILILEDVDSFFETNVISIETDENKHCFVKEIEKYKLKNTLFDGQGLIDSSIFPKWADGFVLLRHHFTKMACFNTHIQKFFKDYFGESYENAIVKDMWGNEHFAKDIKLITTNNAVKWLKFNISYEYWCKKVNENGNLFGIVKTAHGSKVMENIQKMSYQMVNSLDLETMNGVVQKTVSYVERMKNDDQFFLDYLRDNINFANDYEALVYLCENNPEFVRSQYFRDRKNRIIDNYIRVFRSGKVLQQADNLTIIGSPYAMLLHSVGEDVNKDDTFTQENGCIQCYTEAFAENEYLAEFRSPFNSRNNLGYMHNVRHEKLSKYFDLGKLCIAINMIGTDFQDSNNGSDQDSDTIYTTNQTDIVAHARHCVKNYPTIVNNIPKEANHYDNTMLDKAIVDNKLAAANLAIGESSNLAQLCLTYTYNFDDVKYYHYACILSVLAQVAIDNAKRSFDIDLNQEIKRIKSDMDISHREKSEKEGSHIVVDNGYPAFFSTIKKRNEIKTMKISGDALEAVGKKYSNLTNHKLKCPMNHLASVKFEDAPKVNNVLQMDYFFESYSKGESRRKCKKVEELVEKYSLELHSYNTSNKDDNLLERADFEELIEDIKRVYISSNYIGLFSWLINRAFLITPSMVHRKGKIDSKLDKNKSLLIATLYHVNKQNLLKCFSKNLDNYDKE